METRRGYRERLLALEDSLLRAGDGYRNQLVESVRAVLDRDPSRAKELVSGDDELDELALAVRDEAIELMALHSPVAGELRLLSAILQVDTMLERIGELAINIARTAHLSDPDATDPTMQQLEEMGRRVDALLLRALEGFGRRRDDTAALARLDDQVDRLRSSLQQQLTEAAERTPGRVDWGIRMSLVATMLERAGDLAVGIARHTRFVVSGVTPRPRA